MEFGVFDHLDRNALPLPEFYEMRLAVIAAYDAAGFYGYHVAEHHGTPVGMAPSPGVFLSAVAQRTTRLRFGPLVYLLPLYEPLRLIEEVCMLDQMSGGRFQLGVGRGVSPIEVGFFNLDPDARTDKFVEALAVLRQGLTHRVLDFEGRYYRYKNVPMELEPKQKPHPPIWVGVERPDGAERAAREGFNFISAHPVEDVRVLVETYRANHSGAGATKLGLARFIVVAETDAEALALARRAYPRWHASLTHLARTHGSLPIYQRPAEFDATTGGGRGIAGSPATVAAELSEQLARSGANYCVGQFAFGDLTQEEVLRSVSLFASEVMPRITSP
jgi:alkanesulfonate monooxygenase SsuD/methylene tetrahydromethanopterin reductase-like flavin-dependent oxidoreductase (luciferase family)